MRRFFVKNILFVITVNVLIKPIWAFFIDRPVQNSVHHGSYGTYLALMNIAIIFQIVMDFGITNYNSRTIAGNPDKLSSFFPAMLSARLTLILVYIILAFSWGFALGYRGRELVLLGGVLLIQALNSIVLFLRSNVSALQKFKTDGLLSVTDRFLMIIICGFLLLYPGTAHNFKIEWFVITQIICYSIAALIGYAILRRISGIRLRFSFNAPMIISIMKESFPYALLIFLMSVYTRSDATIIERILKDGKDQADIWAAAYRLIDQANVIGLMFATVLLSLFGRMLAQKENVNGIVKLCVNMLIPFSGMVAIGGIFFSHDIMHLLYHNSAVYSIMPFEYEIVFALLIASYPAWCLTYIYSTLLTANGSLKTLNIIAFAGVVVNLSLNFWLIPMEKAEGAAATALITQTGVALAYMVFAAKVIKLPFSPKWVASLIGYLLLILTLAYGIIALMHHTPWYLQFISFVAACIALMFVFRFISVNSLRQLMSKQA